MIEVLVVLGIIGVLSAITLPVALSYVTAARADSGSTFTYSVLHSARDRAIAERRNYLLTITEPNRIVIERVEVPSGTLTLVSDVLLENGQQFVVFGALPDTPDAFGTSSPIAFGGTGPYMFTSDGSLIDSAGDPANGTLFMGLPEQEDTARAVTIFGVTGLLRQWKWRGNAWVE